MMAAASNGSTPKRFAFSRSGLDDGELQQLVQSHASLFKTLADATILITGATGWFGVWLLDLLLVADDLLRLGVRIAAVSREPGRFLDRFREFEGDSRIKWIKTDVRQLEGLGDGYSHIIHAATDTSAASARDTPQNLFETLVEGTGRVIAAAGPGCKSALLVSSGAIYGPPRPGTERFVESEPGGPDPCLLKSAYAEGKRAAEQLGATAAAKGVPIKIARCFAFVGPHMPFDKHFAIGNFIADAVQGRSICVKSDGRPLRSYLYMTDLIHALLLILSRGVVGRPYNVGSDQAITIEALAHCVNRTIGGVGVSIGGAPSDPGDRYVPDITRLRTELGFVPDVALEGAIARTAAWYRARMNESVSS